MLPKIYKHNNGDIMEKCGFRLGILNLSLNYVLACTNMY